MQRKSKLYHEQVIMFSRTASEYRSLGANPESITRLLLSSLWSISNTSEIIQHITSLMELLNHPKHSLNECSQPQTSCTESEFLGIGLREKLWFKMLPKWFLISSPPGEKILCIFHNWLYKYSSNWVCSSSFGKSLAWIPFPALTHTGIHVLTRSCLCSDHRCANTSIHTPSCTLTHIHAHSHMLTCSHIGVNTHAPPQHWCHYAINQIFCVCINQIYIYTNI